MATSKTTAAVELKGIKAVADDGTSVDFPGYKVRFISEAEGYEVLSDTVHFRIHSYDEIAAVLAGE